MHDIMEALEAWLQEDEKIAVATVVSTWGSSPRPVGSKLVTTLSGKIAGSVSAGCVESAVVEACQEAIKTGEPRLITYGVTDEEAWDVGLTCGGTIKVLVEPFTSWRPVFGSIKRHLEEHNPFAVVNVIGGTHPQDYQKMIVLADGSVEGDFPFSGEINLVVAKALALLAQGIGETLQLDENLSVFIEVHPVESHLIIVGAVHIAEILVTFARLLGFRTTIIDPRSAFATRERFPQADRLLQEWPQHVLPGMKLDSSTYVAVVSHDPKLDDPALEVALSSNARYVGALGSRKTNAQRLERLRSAGRLDDAQLSRLHAPIGLPLGGRSASEIALSIIAEVVQTRSSAPGNR